MIILADQAHCTGCGACSAICREHAITMRQSEKDGFYRPHLDKSVCIECKKCEWICPELCERPEINQYYGKVYAAVNLDDEKRNASASGGIFAALAEGILKKNGLAAGVAYDGHLNAVYELEGSIEGLRTLMGSKYMQSKMGNIYSEISQKLKEGKEVLFCGTPCHVAAIKRFTREKGLEERLTTVDVLCRGVPSPKVFHKYIEGIENQQDKKVVFVKFKDNENGWHGINTRIIMEDGSECYLPILQSTYLNGFLQDNMTVRESCFHCSYKKMERPGDITIGDFWGLKNTRLEDDKGTSLVILNSRKGVDLWEEIKHALAYKESTMWRVVKGNGMAFQKLPANPNRERFWQYLEQYDYEKALCMARS